MKITILEISHESSGVLGDQNLPYYDARFAINSIASKCRFVPAHSDPKKYLDQVVYVEVNCEAYSGIKSMNSIEYCDVFCATQNDNEFVVNGVIAVLDEIAGQETYYMGLKSQESIIPILLQAHDGRQLKVGDKISIHLYDCSFWDEHI